MDDYGEEVGGSRLNSIRARRRFKAIVRLVIINKSWLCELEDEQLGKNVQRNVQMLITRRRGYESIITLQDKAILNKDAQWRTDKEKQRLNVLVGTLNCFKKYPEYVKSQLATACYFAYFGPGRTVVKEGHQSEGLYFIISGSVLVYQLVHDPVLDEYNDTQVGRMEKGSMFGELSLLHDIPRMATIVTETPCELLKLKRDDFNSILKKTIEKEWDHIKLALKKFTYFNHWNEITIRECCYLSKLKTYSIGDTILGDGIGSDSSVYFVISGKCKIIEELHVKTKVDNGWKTFSLYKPDLIRLSARSRDSFDISAMQVITKTQGQSKYKEQIMKEFTKGRSLNEVHDVCRLRSFRTGLAKPKSSCVKSHFMQVCFLMEKACFGFGELPATRRFVADSATTCLVIPRYWLMLHNDANIWSRTQNYLKNYIPTTEQVFEKFLAERKWMEYRKNLKESLLKKPPTTSISNIPFSIRVNEDYEYE